jgi:hypothetical protein
LHKCLTGGVQSPGREVDAQVQTVKKATIAVPPTVVMVDGLWVHIAYPTGEYRDDALYQQATEAAAAQGKSVETFVIDPAKVRHRLDEEGC